MLQASNGINYSKDKQKARYLLVGDARLTNLTGSLRKNTPDTHIEVVPSSKFSEVHARVRSVMRENVFTHIVMLETMGDFFHVKSADKERSTASRARPGNPAFIPVQYRRCDLKSVVTKWTSFWKNWRGDDENLNRNIAVEVWFHQPVEMNKFHGGRIGNLVEAFEQNSNFTLREFKKWRMKLVEGLQEEILLNNLNVKIRFLRDLHRNLNLEDLYNVDRVTPKMGGILGIDWIREVRVFFGDSGWGPERETPKHALRITTVCDCRKLVKAMIEAAGHEPQNFQPELNSGLCVGIVEALQRKFASGNNSNQGYEESGERRQDGVAYQHTGYQSTGGPSSYGQSTYEIGPSLNQPSTSQVQQTSRMSSSNTKRNASRGVVEIWKNPSGTSNINLPVTPGKDLPVNYSGVPKKKVKYQDNK